MISKVSTHTTRPSCILFEVDNRSFFPIRRNTYTKTVHSFCNAGCTSIHQRSDKIGSLNLMPSVERFLNPCSNSMRGSFTYMVFCKDKFSVPIKYTLVLQSKLTRTTGSATLCSLLMRSRS